MTASALAQKIQGCTICKDKLPYSPRPVFSFSNFSRVLVVGQAPGIKVHNSGIPWNDASGIRLRDWLGVTSEIFYNPGNFAIVPMGLCYPGKGKSGDLPPRPECAKLWMQAVLSQLQERKLTILIGQYAVSYFLKELYKKTLTLTILNWREYFPEYIVLPHPSPRNNIWLRKNPWFEMDVLPVLKETVQASLI